MKKILLSLALLFTPSLAWAQCTGMFPANTLCGNLTGSPQPPAAFSASTSIVGPGVSTIGDIVDFANGTGNQLSDSGIPSASVAQGPGSAVSGNFPSFNGTGGKLLQDSGQSLANFGGINFTPNNQYYVGGTGASDSNDCRAATVGGGHGPCATIQFATAIALSSNANDSGVFVNIAAGSYTECVNVAGTPINNKHDQGPFLTYNGAGAGSTTWTGCNSQFGVLIANQNSDVGVKNMTMVGTGLTGQSVLYAQLGGIIEVFSGMVFGQASNCHFFAENAGSQIQIWNSYSVLGNTTNGCHASATSNAYIEWNPGSFTITLNTPETYTTFFQASFGGGLYQDNNTFTGSATGTKFNVTMNGWVLSGVAGGCANLPGSVAGSTGTGGQCP